MFYDFRSMVARSFRRPDGYGQTAQMLWPAPERKPGAASTEPTTRRPQTIHSPGQVRGLPQQLCSGSETRLVHETNPGIRNRTCFRNKKSVVKIPQMLWPAPERRRRIPVQGMGQEERRPRISPPREGAATTTMFGIRNQACTRNKPWK